MLAGVVVGALCVGFLVGKSGVAGVGGTTNFDAIALTEGFTNTGATTLASTTATTFKVGQTGTQMNRSNRGICYIKAYATTIAASSTVKVDCQATALSSVSISALPGIAVGDFVSVSLSTTTAGTTSNGIVLTGAAASTTNGYIELTLSNLTGATFTWPTSGAATGTASYAGGN